MAGLEERRTVVQAELASLDSARDEIEEVKSEAAEAAAELAKFAQELASKRDEFERLNAECDPAHIAELQQELKRLAQEQSDINSMLPALRAERDSALQRIEEASGMQARIAARELDRNRLDKEIGDLEAKIR